MNTDPSDIVERLRDVKCNREPFTPDHANCVCRLANEAADYIERKAPHDVMGLHAQAALIGALDPDNRFPNRVRNMTYKHGNMLDYMLNPTPAEEISARFDRFATYPEKFGAATSVIEHLERKIEWLCESLTQIRDKKLSRQECQELAAYTLGKLDKI